MTPEEQRRRRAVQRLAHVWPNGWTKHKADAYQDVLSDQHPDDVEHACTELARTWSEKILPPPAVILEHATRHARTRTHQREQQAAQAARARGRDRNLPPSRLLVGNRLCHTCRGDLLYLTGENILWCEKCRAAQTTEHAGHTRIQLTTTEREDLHLRPEPNPHQQQAAA